MTRRTLTIFDARRLPTLTGDGLARYASLALEYPTHSRSDEILNAVAAEISRRLADLAPAARLVRLPPFLFPAPTLTDEDREGLTRQAQREARQAMDAYKGSVKRQGEAEVERVAARGKQRIKEER